MNIFNARLLLMLAAALPVAACTPDQKPSEAATKIIEELDKGKKSASIGGTLEKQAADAAAGGDYNRAAQVYHQLLDKDPDNKANLLAFGDSLRRGGNFDQAVQVYDKLLTLEPRSADAMEGKGLSLMGRGEFVDAGQQLSEVMKIDGKRWRTLNAIGILFATKNLVDEGMAYYEEALKQSPGNPSVLNNVGLSLAIDKQYDKALEAFALGRKQVTSGSMEQKRIDLNTALIYGVQGKLEEAQRIATPHLSEAGLYNNMGFYAHLSKDEGLAKSYLNMALTNSTSFYERAWENLQMVSDGGENTSGIKPKVVPIIAPPKKADEPVEKKAAKGKAEKAPE